MPPLSFLLFSYFNILYSGQILLKGQQLTSPNGIYKAIMQNDGNFVLYGKNNALWSTDTVANGDYLIMQEDGNLNIYVSCNFATWSSNTQFSGDYLVCQDDGNLVIYNEYNEPVWSTNTQNRN